MALGLGLGNIPKMPTPKVNLKRKFLRQRNQFAHQGPKERQRRIAQGKAGTCYIHGTQYPRPRFIGIDFGNGDETINHIWPNKDFYDECGR